MAIRFYCQRCGQLLSIASRKAGTLVDCPKCGIDQEVPSQAAADAGISLATAAEAQATSDGPADKTNQSQDTADSWTPAAEEIPIPIDETPARPKTSATPARDDYILLPRRTIYLQAILFIVVALVALGMGFLIGRGTGTQKTSHTDVASDSTEADPVLLEGRLTFQSRAGKIQPDHNAAIIALPETLNIENARPDKRIPSPGIRSLDPPPDEDYVSLHQIQELGGSYARTDEDGRFSMVLPDSGRYHLLLISRAAVRPADTHVDPADLEQIARFFRRPAYLIGDRKYRLKLEKFEIRAQIELNFDQTL